uniref:AAA family ATPase n=1 Tax=Paenibacillus koleovorans TaxID=121608 RepID=UPI0013E3E67C
MKTMIGRLDVDAFGKLRDRRYELELRRPHAVTLFHGPNEAGKSTLLAFIRAMLLGLPSRGTAVERHEPVGGGAHGGSLLLFDDAGGELRVERRFGAVGGGGAGAGNGNSSGGGSAAGKGRLGAAAEAQLNAMLGGLSGELFRSLFAFSLTELQELSTLQADELSGYLYSAGWGTSGKAVVAVERRLALEAERLYRPRGKNQELALAIRAWEDEEAGLRRSREQLSGYNKLADELQVVETKISETEEEAERLRASVVWADKLLQAEEPYHRAERARARLEELRVFESFPAKAGERYEQAAAELELRLSALRQLEARRARLERELADELRVDAALLAERLRLDELVERAGAYRERQAAAAARRSERGQLEQELARLLERLGPGWSEASVAAVPASVAAHEGLRAQGEERQRLARRRELLQAELESAERQAAAAERERLQQEARLVRLRQDAARRFAAWRELSGDELRYHMQQLRREAAEWLRLHGELRRLSAGEQDALAAAAAGAGAGLSGSGAEAQRAAESVSAGAAGAGLGLSAGGAVSQRSAESVTVGAAGVGAGFSGNGAEAQRAAESAATAGTRGLRRSGAGRRAEAARGG